MKKYTINEIEFFTHMQKPTFWFKHQYKIALLMAILIATLVLIGTYYTVLYYVLTY